MPEHRPVSSAPTATEVLAIWRGLLGELATLGDGLCAAIDRDETVAAIASMMELRRVRSALSRVDVPPPAPDDVLDPEAVREVAALTLDAGLAEAAMAQWHARPLPAEAKLLESPLGVAVLADAVLPDVWDFEADLVVLVGAGLEPVAQVLASIGQRRIITLGADAAAVAGVAIPAAQIDEIVIAVRSMVPISPRRMVVHASVTTPPELAHEVTNSVRETLSDLRVHRNTMQSFSRTWLEQMLANLPQLARWPSIAAFDERFAGIPMVIVAPGPSLATNVAQLRALAGRAVIVAFSHSLKPVLAAGVTPDLVLTVDPQDVRYHFEGCDVSRTCLVNGATVHPSLFELPARRCLTLSANGPVDDWMFEALGEQAVVPGGGSVATSALSLAVRWRCDPIIFLGLDLSFTDSRYYVETSSDGEARADIDANGVMRVAGWSQGFRAMKAGGGPAAAGERVVELPGWHGGTVRSSFMFSMFHRWFENSLRGFTGATVYNCTEGGARIAGMTHRPFAEIAATLTHTYDIDGILGGVEVDPGRSRQIAQTLGAQLVGLRRAKRYARNALQLIERGITGRRLERVERTLGKTLQSLDFVSLLAQREVERAEDVAHRPASADTYLAASVSLFEKLISIIDEVGPSIDRAIDRITSWESR